MTDKTKPKERESCHGAAKPAYTSTDTAMCEPAPVVAEPATHKSPGTVVDSAPAPPVSAEGT